MYEYAAVTVLDIKTMSQYPAYFLEDIEKGTLKHNTRKQTRVITQSYKTYNYIFQL